MPYIYVYIYGIQIRYSEPLYSIYGGGSSLCTPRTFNSYLVQPLSSYFPAYSYPSSSSSSSFLRRLLRLLFFPIVQPIEIFFIIRLPSYIYICIQYTYFNLITKRRINETSLRGDYTKVQPGDCIVAFSKADIFSIKRQIESGTPYKCAIIYGQLPSETRSTQARLFNEEGTGYDILVASDAIGMGLNLNIRRIIFHTTIKRGRDNGFYWLDPSGVKQIGGRAGRLSSNYKIGEVTAWQETDLAYVRSVMNFDLPQIPSAGIFPTVEQVELFSQQMLESMERSDRAQLQQEEQQQEQQQQQEQYSESGSKNIAFTISSETDTGKSPQASSSSSSTLSSTTAVNIGMGESETSSTRAELEEYIANNSSTAAASIASASAATSTVVPTDFVADIKGGNNDSRSKSKKAPAPSSFSS